MHQTSIDKADASTSAVPTTPCRLRPASALKRQMSESPILRSPSTKTISKRVKIDEAFANPWRCEAPAYVPLPITHHTPLYNPPCYFDENLNHLTKSEKALRIMSYHYALNMQLSIYARAQPQHAAVGDPVQACPLFNGVLDKKKPTTSAGNVFLDQESTYISRSGRHVRRRHDPSAFQQSDDDEEEQKAAKKAKIIEEPVKTTPVVKRIGKKMTNEDIMARSSLFADSPVLPKTPRTQTIFAKMEESEKEAKKAELEKKRFEKTLQQASDEEIEMEITSSHSPGPVDPLASDDDFVKRRIIPPLTGKKRTISAKKLDLPSTSATTSSDDGNMKSIKTTGGSATSTTGNKRVPKKKSTDCPICGKSFQTKEIEEHASTCGLTNEVEIESSIPNQRVEPSHY